MVLLEYIVMIIIISHVFLLFVFKISVRPNELLLWILFIVAQRLVPLKLELQMNGIRMELISDENP